MNSEGSLHETESATRNPPRERILEAARELFYRHGIRAVGVDAVAEAAGTNKMTLYRHFASKDELVAACLRQVAEKAAAFWERLEATHPDDATARLRGWVKATAEEVALKHARGCAMANAAVELADKEHPARQVILCFKKAQRERLTELCREAGLAEPELLADELYLVFEGARVSAQSIGVEDLGSRLRRIGEAVIKAHAVRQ